MKKLIFTSDELELLEPLLKKRIERLQNDNIKPRVKYISALQTALEKVIKGEADVYKSFEKTMLISVINENFDSINADLTIDSFYNFLFISDEQIKVANKIDCCENILKKCGYKYVKGGFSYAEMFDFINKLKNSTGILLSRSGENDYYKIGFVYEKKEYTVYRLKSPITFEINRFIKFESSAQLRFTLPLKTKQEAKELLSNAESDRYPKDVLEIINVLLD